MTKDTLIRKQKELIDLLCKYGAYYLSDDEKDKVFELAKEVRELESEIDSKYIKLTEENSKYIK